jgi:hypothetical protein
VGAAAALDPPAPTAAFHEAGRFLPQGSVGDWVQTGGVRYAQGDELFQLIDGAGEKYRAYGFRQLARTEYRKPGTQLVVTVEVYDMGSTLGAYGQFSMLLAEGRDPASLRAQATAHGGGGFLGSSQLVFWKGQHLVQVNLADEDENADETSLAARAREALPAFAARVDTALPGETTAPSTPPALGPEGRVWGGALWLAQGLFGAERTGPGWEVHYETPEHQRYRVGWLARASPAEGAAAFASLRAPGAAPVPGLEDESFAVTTAQGERVVARRGALVVVVADAGLEGLAALPRAAKIDRLRALLAAPTP